METTITDQAAEGNLGTEHPLLWCGCVGRSESPGQTHPQPPPHQMMRRRNAPSAQRWRASWQIFLRSAIPFEKRFIWRANPIMLWFRLRVPQFNRA